MSLTDAAERLGVHYMTAYRYVRLGHLRAEKVGTEWRILPEDLAAYVADGPLAKAPPTEHDLKQAKLDLQQALVDGDEAAAWQVVEPILERVDDATVLHTSLLGPALADIGEAWAAGNLTIAAEHRATAVARRLIGRARPWFRGPGRRRGLVVVGAPESDHHALPTALFADLVRAEGPDVIDLGAQTPASTFADVARETSGQLVISVVVTHLGALDDVRQIASAVHEADPTVPILIGGYAVPDEETAMALGATHWSKSNDDAATLVGELIQL